jgi:RNA polymerase sporulation-specific sigma factor
MMPNPYTNQTDEELITRLREGETAITEFICNKYKDLVRSKAKSMYLLGADTEDLLQEGMIGLFKAVRDYDSGRDASFFTFAELCISRQIYTAVQASRRHKHAPLNTYISLYASAEKGEISKEDKNLIKAASSTEPSPEALLIDRENAERLERIIEKELSKFEKQVLDLHLVGNGYTEIARILGKDVKATDNALQRVKAKLKKVL